MLQATHSAVGVFLKISSSPAKWNSMQQTAHSVKSTTLSPGSRTKVIKLGKLFLKETNELFMNSCNRSAGFGELNECANVQKVEFKCVQNK